MASVERAVDRQSAKYPVRRRRAALWLALFTVLLTLGGVWLYYQHAFEQKRLALVESVQNGNEANVRTLLEQGVDPNTSIRFQIAPSLLASIGLLLRGPSQESTPLDETVLMYAADQDRENIVRLLLEHGADVNRRDGPKGGQTALHYAAHQGARSSMKVLLAHGATVDAMDGFGLTPLYSAILAEFFEGDKPPPKASTQCVDLLLQHGAEVNFQASDGSTPLMAAACGTAYGSLCLLLNHGADVNAHDNSGVTPLMCAAKTLQVDSVRKLLQSGATINAQDAAGKSALRYAVEEGYAKEKIAQGGLLSPPYMETLSLLINHGADPNGADRTGNTPLEAAKALPNPVVHFLLKSPSMRPRL